jgi:type IV secretion system protein VirB5
MNTYLKVTILVLATVCFALAALTFKSQKALADMHPMIVRINDVGHAEAIDYRNFQYRPQEAENKYYLTRWAELYFSGYVPPSSPRWKKSRRGSRSYRTLKSWDAS